MLSIEFDLKDRNGEELQLGDSIELFDWGNETESLGVAQLYFDEEFGHIGIMPELIEDRYDLWKKALPRCIKVDAEKRAREEREAIKKILDAARKDIVNVLTYDEDMGFQLNGPFSHNIIGLVLRGVAEKTDYETANILVDEFNLEDLGFNKE